MNDLSTREGASEKSTSPFSKLCVLASRGGADLDKCSAIIELVDNAVDASATKCNVTIETFDGVQALTVTDDGCGFTCDEFKEFVQQAKPIKHKLASESSIGFYACGLLNAWGALARDMLILSKHGGNQFTVVFVSKSMWDAEEPLCDKPYVPMVSFVKSANDSHYRANTRFNPLNQHEHELRFINKYSPFQKQKLLQQFDEHLCKSSGTRVILFNWRTSATELPPELRNDDIVIQSKHRWLFLRKTLRYMYRKPSTVVYVNNAKVELLYLPGLLTRRIAYSVDCSTGSRNEELEKFLADCDSRDETKKLKRSALFNMQKAIRSNAQENVSGDAPSLEHELNLLNWESDCSARLLREFERFFDNCKVLVTFGLCVSKRWLEGVYWYTEGRLVKRDLLTQSDCDSLIGRGVVCIVDVPRGLLPAILSKQSFLFSSCYSQLLQQFKLLLPQFLQDSELETVDWRMFWNEYGYSPEMPFNVPPDPVRLKNALDVEMWLQCDQCLKHRLVRTSLRCLLRSYKHQIPVAWTCSIGGLSCEMRESVPKSSRGNHHPPLSQNVASLLPEVITTASSKLDAELVSCPSFDSLNSDKQQVVDDDLEEIVYDDELNPNELVTTCESESRVDVSSAVSSFLPCTASSSPIPKLETKFQSNQISDSITEVGNRHCEKLDENGNNLEARLSNDGKADQVDGAAQKQKDDCGSDVPASRRLLQAKRGKLQLHANCKVKVADQRNLGGDLRHLHDRFIDTLAAGDCDIVSPYFNDSFATRLEETIDSVIKAATDDATFVSLVQGRYCFSKRSRHDIDTQVTLNSAESNLCEVHPVTISSASNSVDDQLFTSHRELVQSLLQSFASSNSEFQIRNSFNVKQLSKSQLCQLSNELIRLLRLADESKRSGESVTSDVRQEESLESRQNFRLHNGDV